jgi:hypothetical protein
VVDVESAKKFLFTIISVKATRKQLSYCQPICG